MSKTRLNHREKILARGFATASNSELLALILGSGTKQDNALELATAVLQLKPLQKLADLSFSELLAIPGVGSVKASRILASLELGLRAQQQPLPSLLSPQAVWQETRDLHEKSREYLVAFYLSARQQLLSKHVLAVGSINQTIIEPRDVFSEAVKLPCTGIILVHNHPSGDEHPSDADTIFTEQIVAAGELLGIQILDHIIVTKKTYFSFRAQQLL